MKNSEFPEGTCVVKITQSAQAELSEHLSQAEMPEPDRVIAQKLVDPASHQSFGLKFLLNNSRNIQLSDQIVNEVFTAIARIGSKPLIPVQQPSVMVEGSGQTEEQI